MAQIKTFKSELIAEGGGHAIVIPFDAEKAFGQRGRMPVRGTINGVEYRSSIFRMGRPCHFMVVNRQLREACVVEAKREDTKARRIEKTIAALNARKPK